VFTRTKHRADRLADYLVRHKIDAERIHGNRSQSQRTQALAGFKSGKHRVLVATDIAARGIDVEALGHVINFDVPNAGDTSTAWATQRRDDGDAFTFSPAEEKDMLRIERDREAAPAHYHPDFDYKARPARLELSNRERSDARARSGAKQILRQWRTSWYSARQRRPRTPSSGGGDKDVPPRLEPGGSKTTIRAHDARAAPGSRFSELHIDDSPFSLHSEKSAC
jgi:ATP-dependent RNA helicase RhlE